MRFQATLPGGKSGQDVATTVGEASLERHLGQIADGPNGPPQSTGGKTTRINLQSGLNRAINGRPRGDGQGGDVKWGPRRLPPSREAIPNYRKVNPPNAPT